MSRVLFGSGMVGKGVEDEKGWKEMGGKELRVVWDGLRLGFSEKMYLAQS